MASAKTYTSWKKKTVEAKPVNIASFTDFPDLGLTPVQAKKKDVLAGISLANRLKETIAEEEALQTRRMKREEKEEAWLRANCVSLPLKNYKGPTSQLNTNTNTPTDDTTDEYRTWMHEEDVHVPMPMFRSKSVLEAQRIAKLRKLQLESEERNYSWQLSREYEEEDDRVSIGTPTAAEDDTMNPEEDDSTFDNHE